jgi:C4-dicarboxylate transporter, DctM subunit
MSSGAVVVLIGLVVLLIGLGQPVYILLGTMAAFLLLEGGVFDDFGMLTSIVEMTRRLADNEVLLAIPFFVVAGNLMVEGAIARRLIEFAKALFGWLPGGIALSAIFACVLFAAISGSSPVTVIAIGAIMYPALVKDGYGERFSSGLVTSAGSLGILIPPSIPMIVYAIADPTGFREPERGRIVNDGVELGVADLFLAGVGPGLLIATILGVFAIAHGVKHKVPRSTFSLERQARTFVAGFWALLLPVLILGGIYSGAFTATQAACVAVVYALVIEVFVHRSLDFRGVHRVFSESFVLIGALLVILAVAQGFNYYVTRAEIAHKAVRLLYDLDVGPVGFLLIVNGLLLLVGCVMDILSAILILVPLLAPIANQVGVHPLHLGIIFIVNLEIGYLTPPLGINLFVASTLFRKSLGDIIKAVIPFTALMLGALLLVTYIPTISLGPVAVMHDSSFDVPFPEPHIPLDKLPVPDAVKLLANFGRALEEAEAAAPAPRPGRVLTLEEIMNQSIQTLEREELSRLQYATLAELLADYRAVADGIVRIRDLSLRRARGGGAALPLEQPLEDGAE